jgi:hypothetical protein
MGLELRRWSLVGSLLAYGAKLPPTVNRAGGRPHTCERYATGAGELQALSSIPLFQLSWQPV